MKTSLSPRDLKITSSYGPRRDPFTGRWKFHYGIDLVTTRPPKDALLRATQSGIFYYDNSASAGRGTAIENGDRTDFIAHCSERYVRPGEHVKEGQIIARMGDTGHAKGVHAHFAVKIGGHWVNPSIYLLPFNEMRFIHSIDYKDKILHVTVDNSGQMFWYLFDKKTCETADKQKVPAKTHLDFELFTAQDDKGTELVYLGVLGITKGEPFTLVFTGEKWNVYSK